MRRSVLASLVLVAAACASLPRAPPHVQVVPKLDAAAPITACWLEYLSGNGPAGPATAGWTRTRKFHGTVSGLLVKHPKGDILLDVGNSSHYWAEIKHYSVLRHFYLGQTSGRMKRKMLPADALRAAGVEPSELLYVLLSHGHIDHAGGMIDLPGVKAMMAKEEWDWMQATAPKKTIQVVPAHEKTLEGRVETIAWTNTPYETFDESADLFGDGSVVVVKLFGHTPGSIGTFVNVSPEKRIFHVGDTAILKEQYERARSKGYLMHFTDNDRNATDRNIEKLVQLHEMDPALTILPAHDRDVWESIFGKDPRCLEPSAPG